MIEFDLQVSPSFLEALLPYLGKVFRETSGRFAGERFAPPESGDEDLDAAWREGLIEDGRSDRLAFSRLLGNPKLARGQVEIPVDDVDDAHRGQDHEGEDASPYGGDHEAPPSRDVVSADGLGSPLASPAP